MPGKYASLILMLLKVIAVSVLPAHTAAQIILNETFDDGNFTENPEWTGDAENWLIIEENGNNLLRLNASAAGVSYLSTASVAGYGLWEFSVRLDGFATSNTNRAHVFLISDRPDSREGVNGYAVRIGESGSNKFFRIVRFDDGNAARIIVTGETLIEPDVLYRVRVTRNPEGEWALFVASAPETEPQPEGTPATDTTWETSSWFGVRATYTATRTDRFFFDDFFIEKLPVFVAGFQVLSPSALQLRFSEEVLPATVNAGNLTITRTDGSPVPEPALSLSAGRILDLLFDEPLPGGAYLLQLSGVTDTAGGVLEDTEIPFFIEDVALPGDIVINEFFYDSAAGWPQYVELFNQSGKTLNLNSWRIQDNTATVRRLTTADFYLAPGEMIVLTGNAAGLENRFGPRNYLEMGNFPSLNRASADQIKIFDAAEARIDSLRYEPAVWGGTGVALERRSGTAISHSPENWAESTDPLGGTPGLPNTAEPDPEPLQFLEVSFLDSQTLVLRFDREPDRITAETPGNYQLSGIISVTAAEKSAPREVQLSLSLPMLPAADYTLTVSGVETIFGVPMQPQSRSFTFYTVVPVSPGEVIINEFMYRAAPGWSRFIELYNRSEKAFDLAGWTYNNDTGNRRVITENRRLLLPGSYVVLAPDAVLLQQFPNLPLINMGSRFSALKLGGDDIVIRDAEGVLVDSLRYRPNWGGFEVSLERRSVTAPSWFAENWGDSPGPLPGTPGAPNLIPPDQTSPELLAAFMPEENRITLQFSKPMDQAEAENPANFQLEPDKGIESITAAGAEIRLLLASGLVSGEEVLLSLQNLTDIFGNPLGDLQLPVVYYDFEPAEAFDVVVSEFFYDDALPGGPPQYVELFNRSGKIINLNGWRIQDNTTTVRRITLTDRALLPGEYVVLTREISRFESWFGPRNTIVVSNFPSLNRASADRIRIFSGDEVQVDSLQYSPAEWGGSERALERRSADAISQSPENWAASTDPLLGTPGLPNTAEPDEAPPVFTALTYSGSRTLIARFSRQIDATSAVQPENFDFSGDADISLIQKTAPREIQLSLSDDLINNTSYSLSVRDVRSIFGVPMPEQSRSFTYFEVGLPDSGSVFITEFMYDRPDGYSRFVELHNTGAEAFDLAGWTLSNDTGTRRLISGESYLLAPGAYAVLAPDESLRDIFPDVPLIDMGSRFPALKTGGDAIVLRTPNGQLADSLSYSPAWGGREVALERRTTAAAAWYPENWGNSPAPLLATPGLPNQIPPDTSPPELLSATAPQPDRIELRFSKSMDPGQAGIIQNYQLLPDPGLSSVGVSGDVIQLRTTAALEAGREYRITLQNLTDIFGNPLGEAQAAVVYLDFVPAGQGDVVINEILYRPVSGQKPRFVEVYNRSGENLDLQGWQLGRSTSLIQLTHPSGQIPVRPGGYLVVTEEPELLGLASGDAGVLRVPAIPAFSQNGDAVFIRNAAGLTVDSLRYEPSWGGNPAAGRAIERRDPDSASNDPSNWAVHPEGHSAGFENLAFEPNLSPPQIRFATRTPEGHIELRFSEFVIPDGQTTFSLDGLALSVFGFDERRGNRILLSAANGGSVTAFAGTEQTVQVSRLRDVPGNRAAELSVPLAQQLQAGDVVINEIMFQPLSGSRNPFPDQSEYVEFYNRRPYAVNFEGFHILDEPDFDGQVRRIFPVSTESAWVPANGYAVLFADPQRNFGETRIARFFELDESPMFFRADRSTLSLSTSADAVFLAGADSTLIDSVFYAASWHNPNLPDTRGIALERINPEASGNDASNWGSSVVPAGGTPGSPNSLMQQPADFPAREGLVLEPNPFSPDGDGFDDNLFLSYLLDEPDYLLRVRIFDRHGRLVRTLADGRPAGLSGTLIWDGRRDNGMENRVGIYIVVFEAYNSAAGKTKTFRETVVLARRL